MTVNTMDDRDAWSKMQIIILTPIHKILHNNHASITSSCHALFLLRRKDFGRRKPPHQIILLHRIIVLLSTPTWR